MENEIIDTGIQVESKRDVMAYQELHKFFFNEHGLILLNSDIDDIIQVVRHFQKQFDGKDKATNSTDNTTPY